MSHNKYIICRSIERGVGWLFFEEWGGLLYRNMWVVCNCIDLMFIFNLIDRRGDELCYFIMPFH